MSYISSEQARRDLLAAGITGPHVSHAREGSIKKIIGLVEGDEDATFGLSRLERYSVADILGFMSELTGCSGDIDEVNEQDAIDPELTVAAILEAARRLKDEAERGATLFVGTGHPTGMLEHHIRVADAYDRAGGKIVRLREGEELGIGRKGRHAEVRYVGGVGCLADWGNLKHTHRADPMEALLEVDTWPDIVFADHGFAGAAIERGIPAIAIMDINDHALAIAWAEKRDVVVIPMDDNRPPRLYEPSWRLFEQVLAGHDLGD